MDVCGFFFLSCIYFYSICFKVAIRETVTENAAFPSVLKEVCQYDAGNQKRTTEKLRRGSIHLQYKEYRKNKEERPRCRHSSHRLRGDLRAFPLCIYRKGGCVFQRCSIPGGRQQKSWRNYLHPAPAARGMELLGVFCRCDGRCVRLQWLNMAGILFFAAALSMCPAPGLLLLAALLHECGHLLCAAVLRWRRPAVHLGPAGIALRYAGVHPPWQEIFVCMAGPAANFAAAAICRWSSMFAPACAGCRSFLFYCIGLGAVNLLPIQGLDGGGILGGLCAQLFMPDRAYRICRMGSLLSVLLLWVFNLYIQMRIGFNLSLFAVSLYLTVTVLPGSA